MFILHPRLSNKEIDKSATTAIKQITKWFQANAKRKICKSELWYGKVAKIRRAHVDEDVKSAAEVAKK